MGGRQQAWLSIHRRLCCRVLLGVILVTTAATLVATSGCATQGLRAVVSMRMVRSEKTPRDASVYIDEQYIGPLYYVAAYGVSLPVGEHRVTVIKDGYFPWDALVVADRKPVSLKVELVEIPD